ncbi:PD-(D/E)XK motif protein [Streptomyces sp. NBC_00385]|uniref:PD-(D/E)XK motif protein n=1 Tax=Streptomyces sp. NBC_00385 TaxID=2975733 RepID=UPI002DDAA0F1|nr:PD-(D/E)XK motif protein [Streptomyces sp. NBC_00385]WRZ06853.1 PD-(D/E)XK motif protein [Streptomyces sp. NBC_00385]
MTTADLRVVLEEHWSRLGAEPVSVGHTLRTSALPVGTVHGPILVAVDRAGLRHLLVPLKVRQRVSVGLVSASLRITERPLQDEDAYGRFADIECMSRELDDVFTGLCRDVLVAVEADGDRPYRTARAVVERWKLLFSSGPRSLTREQMVGLFGELRVLVRLLEGDSGAVRHWAGPAGERHDFTDGVHAVEVKSTVTNSERRVFVVHGLDQLEAPEGGDLLLAWQRFEPHPGGSTLDELVDRAADLCDDQAELLSKLGSVGYRPSDEAGQDGLRLSLAEDRWYRVEEDFPRLTTVTMHAGTVPAGVLDVRYTVDLAGARTSPVDETTVGDLLRRVGETT